MNKAFSPYAWDDGVSIDLVLPLEPPGRSWPDGAPVFIQTWSFPLRCREEVLALAREARELVPSEAIRLVKSRAREIMWPN